MSGTFMGVKSDNLTAIGKVVVAAGRVEWVLALVANEIGVTNPTGNPTDVMKEIKKALRTAPAPLQTLSSVLMAWIVRLPPLFEIRHEVIHGVYLQTSDEKSALSQAIRLMRKGMNKPVHTEELEEIAEQLAVAYTDGMNLWGELHIANQSLRRASRWGASPA